MYCAGIASFMNKRINIIGTMNLSRSVMMIVLVVSATTLIFAQKEPVPQGTWTFYAEAAPYEYQSGDIVIGKEGVEYTAKILFGGSYEIAGREVVFEKDQLSFEVTIEGETVLVKGTVTREAINGTASYTEGTIPFEAERKKKAKKD
jgi:hypothetical protein